METLALDQGKLGPNGGLVGELNYPRYTDEKQNQPLGRLTRDNFERWTTLP